MAAEATQLAMLAGLVVGLAVAGLAAMRLRLPAALGYLLLGVVAGAVFQASQVFQAGEETLRVAAEIGVLVLLFAIGLEMDLKRLLEAMRSTSFTLPFDIAIPALAVASLFSLMGWSIVEATALGLAVSLSSTLFGDRLTSTSVTTPGVRRRVLGVLLSEDVAAVALLATIALLGGTGDGLLAPVAAVARLAFLFILLAAGALLTVPRLLDAVARTHSHELLVLAGAGAVVSFGLLGFLAGSAELGALLAGVAAAEAGSRYVVRNTFLTFRGLAIALVFFATGTLVDLQTLWTYLGPGLLLAAVFLASKLVVHIPAAMASGLPLVGSLRTAFALGTVGEFSIILIAAAERQGVAHEALRAVVVAALLVLLFVAALLTEAAPAMAKGLGRLPRRVRRPLAWVVQSMRRSEEPSPHDVGRRRAALRLLASNILLLVGWGILVILGGRRLLAATGVQPSFIALAIGSGLALAVALPLLRGAYRAYRDLVWLLVGLRPGERAGAGRARVRIVDAWIAATAVLVLVPIWLAVPGTAPLLLAAALVAVTVAALAWRQLSGFHRALEGSVTRVLGEEVAATDLLDRTLSRYPWGVRFSAVAVPSDSPVAGRTIQEARITPLTGALVAVVQRRQREVVNPSGDLRLLPGDTLVLMGDAHQLARAEALIVSHGEALTMTAQSHAAHIEECTVEGGSGLVGATLGEADTRAHTGALVIGVWKQNAQHPRPYEPGMRIQAADRLILLGTPLQLQRAKLLAQGLVPLLGEEADARVGDKG